MKNFYPKGTGNSRYLKSSIPATTTHEDLVNMLRNGTFPIDLNGINVAGVAQQGTPLNQATFLKDATASLFGLGTDAVPDDVLALLSKAAIKKTYATKKTLSDVSEGDVVWVIEGDTPAEYYVAKHNYESGLNGTGKTLLLRKEVHSLQPWDSAKSTVFETSSIFQYLNSTFKNTLDPDVRNAITPVKFYCTIGGGNNSVSTITGSIFLASATEMGIDSTPSRFNAEGTEFPVANTLRPFDAYNYVYNAWTRSPTISKGNVSAITQNYSGFTNVNLQGVTENLCIRPCFALPSTFNVYVDKPVTGLYDVSDNLLLKLPGVQIATGSYVGTGTYGRNNPNSLTFEFEPKVIFLLNRWYWNSAKYISEPVSFSAELLSDSFKNIIVDWIGSNIDQDFYASLNGKTFFFYASDENKQCNTSGKNYYYLALG